MKRTWENVFDANWKEYITDALELYITSEGWKVNPKRLAKKDYKKLKKSIDYIVSKQA